MGGGETERDPPDDRWCNILDFVVVGSVSSASTLQTFRAQATCHGWFARESTCSITSVDCPTTAVTRRKRC